MHKTYIIYVSLLPACGQYSIGSVLCNLRDSAGEQVWAEHELLTGLDSRSVTAITHAWWCMVVRGDGAWLWCILVVHGGGTWWWYMMVHCDGALWWCTVMVMVVMVHGGSNGDGTW